MERTLSLSDRPPMNSMRILRKFAYFSGIISVIVNLVSVGSSYVQFRGQYGNLEDYAKAMLVSQTTDTVLSILYYVAIFGLLWAVAVGIDRIDQLIWLSASDSDREKIIKSRTNPLKAED